MKQIVLTCVACGTTETVEDTPENKRNSKCKDCGQSLIERRTPGGGVTSPIPGVHGHITR